MTMTETRTTQVYEVYIKASAQKVWDAITDPEWTMKYAYRSRQEIEPRAGGSFKCFATDEMRSFGMPCSIARAIPPEASTSSMCACARAARSPVSRSR